MNIVRLISQEVYKLVSKNNVLIPTNLKLIN